MMHQKMGETLPAWPRILQDLVPDLLVGTAMNSAGSVGREASTIPARYRSLIAVAAALAPGEGTMRPLARLDGAAGGVLLAWRIATADGVLAPVNSA